MNQTAAPPICPHCRAHQRDGRLSMAHLGHRAWQELFGADRGLAVTAWHLLVRPREVVDAFVRGDAPRYYSPIKYFLVATALSLLLPSPPILDGMLATMLGKQELAAGFDAAQWVADWNWLLYTPLMLLLGAMMRFFFRDRGMNLAEHLVLATYGWSQMLVIAMLAFLLLAGLKVLEVAVVWRLPLLFLSTVYWFWYCAAVLRMRTPADWVRCFAAVPAAVLLFLLLSLAVAMLVKAAIPTG